MKSFQAILQRRCLQWLVCVFCSLGSFAATAAETVEGVRVWRSPDYTRLVLDLSGPIDYKIFPLPQPDRLVVDIKNARLSASLDDLDFTNSPISGIRSSQRDKGDLRVVLDLKNNVKPRSFTLKKLGSKKDRLVIDLIDPQQAKPVQKVVQAPTAKQRDIIIAIDAGHGGEDPGALGPKRIQEKNVVLAISKELAKLVNRQKGFKAVLVRTGDYYIPHKKRRDIARQKRADLFISIHADAFKSPKPYGASVFALSRRGATSETARFLAKRENESDLIGGYGSVSLDDKEEMLAGVLVDLSMTATLNSSLQVGSEVLRSIGGVAPLHKKRVEQAGFAVLKAPDVPSILVETGFISNPGEAKKLATSSYRKKIAKAVFSGVHRYFKRFPPDGSYYAKAPTVNAPSPDSPEPRAKTQSYVIARGDTLSEIAKRFGSSVKEIRAINGMNSTVIKVGQRLKVPLS